MKNNIKEYSEDFFLNGIYVEISLTKAQGTYGLLTNLAEEYILKPFVSRPEYYNVIWLEITQK